MGAEKMVISDNDSLSLYLQDMRRSKLKVQKRDKEIEWFTTLDFLYRKHIACFRLSPVIYGCIVERMRDDSSWKGEDAEHPDKEEKELSWLHLWWRERNWKNIDHAVLLLKDICTTAGLSIVEQGDIQKILKRIEPFHERSIAIRQEVVENNLGLSTKIAMEMGKSGVSADFVADMIQEGNMGLMHAVEKYSLKKGWKFGTYAVWWIRSYMRRLLHAQRGVIRLPAHAAELMGKIYKFENEFEARHGNLPNVKEIVEALGCPVRAVEDILFIRKKDISLSESLHSRDDDEKRSVLDMLEAKIEEPEIAMAKRHLQIRVAEILLYFKPRDRLIIELRYGLGNNEPHSLQEISNVLPQYGYESLSRERVRQIECQAIRRFRVNKRIREQLDEFR